MQLMGIFGVPKFFGCYKKIGLIPKGHIGPLFDAFQKDRAPDIEIEAETIVAKIVVGKQIISPFQRQPSLSALVHDPSIPKI